MVTVLLLPTLRRRLERRLVPLLVGQDAYCNSLGYLNRVIGQKLFVSVGIDKEHIIDSCAEHLTDSSVGCRVTAQARRGVTTWLENRDKRGPVARRFRDLVGEITADCGGPSVLSENQRQIIRRIASLSVWCESQEARMADGEEIDINEFQRTSNSLRRLCESIGLERTARDVNPPSVDAYLASQREPV